MVQYGKEMVSSIIGVVPRFDAFTTEVLCCKPTNGGPQLYFSALSLRQVLITFLLHI